MVLPVVASSVTSPPATMLAVSFKVVAAVASDSAHAAESKLNEKLGVDLDVALDSSVTFPCASMADVPLTLTVLVASDSETNQSVATLKMFSAISSGSGRSEPSVKFGSSEVSASA